MLQQPEHKPFRENPCFAQYVDLLIHLHDTHLVAVCVVSGIGAILTWNPTGFTRFMLLMPGLTVLTPAGVLAVP